MHEALHMRMCLKYDRTDDVAEYAWLSAGNVTISIGQIPHRRVEHVQRHEMLCVPPRQRQLNDVAER